MPRPIFATVLSCVLLTLPAHADPVRQGPANVPENTPAFPAQHRAEAIDSEIELEVEGITTELERPWGLAVLPDGAGYLVTERPGRLRHVSRGGNVSETVTGLPEVFAQRQGGLLDVTLSPDFAEDRVIFITYSKPIDGSKSGTAAARMVLSEDLKSVSEVKDIFVQSPPSPNPMHYGSRILIADGYAWITTGEHFTEKERQYAQDLDKTYGKVIRVTPQGETPEDNPFVGQDDAVSSIWSYGHRNIQGAAWDEEKGVLWTIEHGPAGGDELNLSEPKGNYGWPVVSYGINYDGSPVGSGKAAHAPEGFVEPRYYWDPVIAPAGMIFYKGDMFADWKGDLVISSLKPGGLVRLTLDGDTVTGEQRLLGKQGRVRDVVEDEDGALLVLIDADPGALLRVTPKE